MFWFGDKGWFGKVETLEEVYLDSGRPLKSTLQYSRPRDVFTGHANRNEDWCFRIILQINPLGLGRTFCFKMLLWLLCRCCETDRSGDNCHWKDSLLLTFPRGGGRRHPAEPHGEAPSLPGGRRGEGKAWAMALIVASGGEVRKGRASRLKIGYFE